jgi:HAD superfamily hydrolase (TIGR01509 family)
MGENGSPSLLILDCDGVLIRSEKANIAYYNHIFECFGLPRVLETDREAVKVLHTLSTPQVIESFLPADRRPEALQYAAGVDYALFLPYVEAEPGWGEVLGRWRTSGKVAVATNRGASARGVLEAVGLLGFIDLIVTIRDVARPKPDPDLLLKTLEHFDLPAGQALYVGDSAVDREAAERAGVPFLGFRRHDSPSADSPRQVEQFLRALANQRAPASLRSEDPNRDGRRMIDG